MQIFIIIIDLLIIGITSLFLLACKYSERFLFVEDSHITMYIATCVQIQYKILQICYMGHRAHMKVIFYFLLIYLGFA